MSFLAEYHNGLDARGEDLADEMTPEIAEVVGVAIDLWFAEQTTLKRQEYEELWKPALNASTLKHLGKKLEKLAEGHEAVLFEALKRLYKEGREPE